MSTILPISPRASIKITEHGAIINGHLSEKEWIEAISSMRDIQRSYLKALGDIVSYGIDNFGEETVGRHIEQLEFNLSDANTALGIATLPYDFKAAYPLTPEHYYVLSKLPTEDAKEKWAQKTIKHKLTALELKRSIAAGQILTTKEISNNSGLGSGIATIEGTLFHFSRWQKQMDEQKILALPKDNRLALLEKLSPILTLAAHIAESLEDED